MEERREPDKAFTRWKETEYLITGNTLEAVKRALFLARRGNGVLLAAEETFLAADIGGTLNCSEGSGWEAFFPDFIWENGCLHPDRYKKYLERLCTEAGVSFCYGLFFVEVVPAEVLSGRQPADVSEKTVAEDMGPGVLRVRFASKGGLFEVVCSHLERFESLDHSVKGSQKEGVPETGQASYAAWITDEESGTNKILRAPFNWDPVKTEAENLLVGRSSLFSAFEAAKAGNPALSLGRFALQAEKTLCTSAAVRQTHYDVAVAGGGTSGAMAALYAARGGAKTVLIEPQYDLGGTSTLGGVSTYWFGNRYKDVEEADREVDRLHRKYGIQRRPGLWSGYDDFHAGVRGYVLLKLCLEAGVAVMLGQIVYDVVKEGDRVCGVICTGAEGKRLISASLVIDATGDGDLAYFAGARTVYGSEQECFTYWASLAQYSDPHGYRNNFSSMVMVSDPEDMTRFAVLGRQRGEETFDHGAYVSARESRHIIGKRVIDLRDLCTFRTYEDGIYTCFSNYDPKGKLEADMVYCGYLPPQMQMQVPLSALMATDREGCTVKGLYVAGKAVSATHNAFPGLRMQPDLMHQGAVLGLLAARAAERDCLVEELDAGARKRWIKEITGDGLTLPGRLKYEDGDERSPDYEFYAEQVTGEDRTHWIDVPFTYEETNVSPMLVLVCGDSGRVLPCIRSRIRKLEDEPGEKNGLTVKALKRLALFHGCDDYVLELERDIMERLEAAPGLLQREGSTMCAQLLPDHGVMPEIVYDLNLLSMSDSLSMEPFYRVFRLLKKEERDYADIRKGTYSYMECFAWAAKKSRRPEFIPLLKELAEFPEFKEAVREEAQVSLMAERLQILLCLIYKALAELGAEEGWTGLETLCAAGSLAVRKSAELGKKAAEFRESGSNEKIW